MSFGATSVAAMPQRLSNLMIDLFKCRCLCFSFKPSPPQYFSRENGAYSYSPVSGNKLRIELGKFTGGGSAAPEQLLVNAGRNTFLRLLIWMLIVMF